MDGRREGEREEGMKGRMEGGGQREGDNYRLCRLRL